LNKYSHGRKKLQRTLSRLLGLSDPIQRRLDGAQPVAHAQRAGSAAGLVFISIEALRHYLRKPNETFLPWAGRYRSP
jgi:hypothetical protein